MNLFHKFTLYSTLFHHITIKKIVEKLLTTGSNRHKKGSFNILIVTYSII